MISTMKRFVVFKQIFNDFFIFQQKIFVIFKDKLMEYHKEHGIFPGIAVKQKRSLLPLIVLYTNFLIIGIPLSYILLKVFTSGNWIAITITTIFILTGLLLLLLFFSRFKIDLFYAFTKN
jgi:hypothetical protein